MLDEAGVTVYPGERLSRTAAGIVVQQGRIVAIGTTSGSSYAADVFVDATYEADLMALAGVTHRIGRESIGEYGESRAGVRPAIVVLQVPDGMDLGFPTAAPGALGSADTRVQSSNFRVCLSNDPERLVPFPMPDGYDPLQYEVVLEYIAQRAASSGISPQRSWVLHIDSIGGRRWDLNQNGGVSFGLPGANYDYAGSTDEARDAIDALHAAYQQGFLYFLTNDPRVPVEIQASLRALASAATSSQTTRTGHARYTSARAGAWSGHTSQPSTTSRLSSASRTRSAWRRIALTPPGLPLGRRGRPTPHRGPPWA